MGPSIKDVGKFSRFFDTYPFTVGSFLLLSVGKFGKFLTPPFLKNADVLNGWSLCSIHYFLIDFKHRYKKLASQIQLTRSLGHFKRPTKKQWIYMTSMLNLTMFWWSTIVMRLGVRIFYNLVMKPSETFLWIKTSVIKKKELDFYFFLVWWK